MAGGARVVRLLREADAESSVELRRRGLLEAPLSFGASPEDDMAASAEAVRDRLRQGPEWAILGAFQDGLIGAVGLMRDRYVKASHKAHVWGMYVAPGQRGCGVGADPERLAERRRGVCGEPGADPVRSGAVIGAGARIGDDCVIHGRVSVRERVLIGHRVLRRIYKLACLLVRGCDAVRDFRSIDVRQVYGGLVDQTLRSGLGIVAVFQSDQRRRRWSLWQTQARVRRFADSARR